MKSLSKSEISLIVLVFTLSFIGSMAFRVSVPAVSFYTRKILEASALSVGLLTSSFFAARATFSIITGGLADKFERKIVYAAILGFFLNSLAVQLYVVVTSIPGILIVRFLQGMLNGVAWVSIQFILGKSISEAVRGRVYAVYFSIGSLGVVMGNLLYSTLSEYPIVHVLNVSSILYIASSILSLTILFLLRKVKVYSSKNREINNRGESRRADIIRAVPLMAIVLGVTFFSSMVRGDLIYIYINEAFKVTEAATAQVIAISSFIALVGGYILSWVSDSFGDTLALKIALIVGAIGGVLMGARIYVLAVLGLTLFYIANSGVIPISRRISITHYKLGGTTLGLVNASGNIGAVIGASIIGYLYDILGYTSINVVGVELATPILASALTLIVPLILSHILRK